MAKNDSSKYMKDYLHVISLYLRGQEDPSLVVNKEELDWMYGFSSFHMLRAFFYNALRFTKVQVDQESLKKFEQAYLQNTRKVLAFSIEREALYAYLNEQGIDFLPLKGIVLEKCYRDSCEREFADNDILFADGDEKIKSFFEGRGYKSSYFRKSNHDVYTKDPFLNFEMHRALFAEREDIESVVEYFNGYMSKALPKEGHEKYLKDEDFYLYFLAHAYKHYSVCGCGLRTLIDAYLFLKGRELDFVYIEGELEKLKILPFGKMFTSLVKKAFNEEELDKEEAKAFRYILTSGTYGKMENGVAKGVQEKGKFGYFMSRVFPPMSFYKTAYPWAYKTKILIPIAWLARFFRVLFHSSKKARRELKLIMKSDERSI